MAEQYDFDRVIDRRGTGAYKTDALEARFGRGDLIPLWVADMDFATPPCIMEALRKRLEHPVLGYTLEPAGLWDSVIAWLREQHGWEVDRCWLTYIPGVVKGIALALNVFTKPGDRVVIQPPVYHPFRLVTQANGRHVANNPLRLVEGRYEMDLEHLESLFTATDGPKPVILILSNPHNPGGTVWSRETLYRLAELCAAHEVLVLSDEIHADMVHPGRSHTPFATVSEAAAAHSITFGAPSKTFNIAGVVSSYAVTPDERIRTKFYRWLAANDLNQPPMFAPIATEAAYRHGRPWMEQMMVYIGGNIDFVIDYLARHIPQIRPMRPDASFLVWLDCRELGLAHDELVSLFIGEAGLALNDGEIFGPGGEGFMRLNIAAPRSVLERAMRQLSKAVNG